MFHKYLPVAGIWQQNKQLAGHFFLGIMFCGFYPVCHFCNEAINGNTKVQCLVESLSFSFLCFYSDFCQTTFALQAVLQPCLAWQPRQVEWKIRIKFVLDEFWYTIIVSKMIEYDTYHNLQCAILFSNTILQQNHEP